MKISKNKKLLLLAITLATVLILTSAVNATNTTDHNTDHTISEKTSTPANSEIKETTINKEKVKTSKNTKEEKTINKTDKREKQTKATTQTIEVNNFDEFTNAFNIIGEDTENDEYIINLNEGTYTFKKNTNLIANKNIIINGNNQTISGSIKYKINITANQIEINDLNMGNALYLKAIVKLTNFNSSRITHTYNDSDIFNSNFYIGNHATSNVYNSTLTNIYSYEGLLTCYNTNINGEILSTGGTIIITDNCTLGENFKYEPSPTNPVTIISNLTYYEDYGGNIIKENYNITKDITIPETGNVTFNNCNISAKIKNWGNLTINNSKISNQITNTGNITFTNCNISEKITNNGNLNLINCSLSNNNMTATSGMTDGFLIENKGNTILIDCAVENNTFNITNPTSNVELYGAIVNTGVLNVFNTSFVNNSVGYAIITDKDSQYQYDYGISAGDASCIYNYGGNLTINSSTFKDNYAGKDGGAIVSTNIITRQWSTNHYIYTVTEANTTIDNTKFINNTATGSGGVISLKGVKNIINNSEFTENKILISINTNTHYGGAIELQHESDSPNPYLIINNTLFNNNYITAQAQSWSGNVGTIIGAGERTNITINNCTFKNKNIETISTTESNITSNTFNQTTLKCNNELGGNINIKNNTFTNDSSLNINRPDSGDSTINKVNIIENTFINNTQTSNTVTFTGKEQFILESIKKDNKYLNTSLNDILNLYIPDKIYTNEPITVTGSYTINNPEYYDEDILEQTKYDIYINGNYYQTVDTLEFTITPTTNNLMITVQPTISSTRKTVATKTTTLTDLIITPENYNEYIYQGTLYYVNKDTKVLFNGTFTDKGSITIETNDIILDGTNATFTNTIFSLEATGITIQNMNLENTQTEYPIKNTADNNIITHNTIILTNTEGKTAAIYNKANNTQITYNTITVDGPALTINHDITSAANTQAILLIGGDKNKVEYNNIKVTSTNPSEGFGTIEAITNYDQANNTNISYNNITVTGTANFKYAINSLSNVENITITENTITVTGERYCDGIQVGNGATNILVDNNNITCTCINTTVITEEGAITYGVIATSMGSAESENITITNNNIDITGTVNYAIELYKVNNTQIHSNNITVNGPYSLAIGYSYAPNGNATQNTITINSDSTTLINYITEEIKPENTGIRIQNGTQNISITDNTITTSDVGGQDTTIHTEPDNVTIANNQLTSSNGYGDETIIAPTTANIENNTIETTTTIEVPETIITKTPTTITANVTTINGTPINGGTVTFTIGNEAIAQVEVIDGIATATVTFKQEADATIIASYTPESTGLSTSSAEATTSIQAPITQLNIEDVQLTAGQTVTLTAKVTDQTGNNITGGKVTFKVNGKTVKDEHGKVVYAKVVDGVATVEYTVADNMNGKDLNITATYSGTNKYNKATISITTTVEKTTPTFTTESITATAGATIQLKANITDGDKVINTGKIVFKINGKTVKDEQGKVIYAKVVNNQVIVNYTLPSDMKDKDYNITATFISSDYERLEDTKVLSVTA